jgi:hypothetical protein
MLDHTREVEPLLAVVDLRAAFARDEAEAHRSLRAH